MSLQDHGKDPQLPLPPRQPRPPQQRWTKEELWEIRRLLGRGVSHKSVAAQFGVTQLRLLDACSRHGIITRASVNTLSVKFRLGSIEVSETFKKEAARRGLKPNRFARVLIDRVARDDLFNAVLDDR